MNINKRIKKLNLQPSRILALGFGILILIGTILLSLPIATKSGEKTGIINALFTAASASCVTGLSVVNTADYWSTFGHVIIISLIQMGGLGIMTMATIIAVWRGKRITLKDRLVIKEQLNQDSMTGLVRLTKYIVLATVIIESIGAIILATRFIPFYGLKKGIWFSIFHSISGFCNAGFDLTGDSMAPFVGDIVLNLGISALVIIGGLGFSVYIDMGKTKKIRNLQLHSKLVIILTVALLIIGTIGIGVMEFNNPETLKYLSLKDKGLSAFFQSTITRTAGFNSVPIDKLHESTVYFMIILMFIGGSPGSTGGGIKTTTFGVLVLTTFSVIKGENDVNIFKKRIKTEIIHRALAIIMISMGIILIVSLVLTLTEEARFIDILFESTSAFATVGLSRNLTPSLTSVGRVIISLTMYAGRVGPLTMALAFGSRDNKKNYRYSEGNVLVG